MSEFTEIFNGLSGTSDDFLSNGFHQFYTEFHNEENVDFEFVDHYNTGEGSTSSSPPSEFFDIHQDFDVDQLLWDIGPYTPFDLPEITPLCNESCSNFIKESSENLKFDPLTNNQDVSSSDAEKSLMCPFEGCFKLYAKPTHLKAHLKRHMNDKPYVCLWPDCQWKFSRSDELARHRRSHLGIKPYRCTFCTKAFARSDHLTKHRRVHEKKFNAQHRGNTKLVWPVVPKGRPGRKPKVKSDEN